MTSCNEQTALGGGGRGMKEVKVLWLDYLYRLLAMGK